MTGYTVAEVRARIGVTENQLRYWRRSGLARASVVCTGKEGVPVVYSSADLLRLRHIKARIDLGESVFAIRRRLHHDGVL